MVGVIIDHDSRIRCMEQSFIVRLPTLVLLMMVMIFIASTVRDITVVIICLCIVNKLSPFNVGVVAALGDSITVSFLLCNSDIHLLQNHTINIPKANEDSFLFLLVFRDKKKKEEEEAALYDALCNNALLCR